jgi:hypothetical protein
MPTDDSSPKNWIAPRFVVPDHGDLGVSLIAKERAFLVDVQTSALELKRKGVSVEDAGKQIAAAMKAKYADWPNMGPIPNLVKRIYAEAQ